MDLAVIILDSLTVIVLDFLAVIALNSLAVTLLDSDSGSNYSKVFKSLLELLSLPPAATPITDQKFIGM